MKKTQHKVKYGELLYKNYGWAYSLFKRTDITFDDLISKVCRKEIVMERK